MPAAFLYFPGVQLSAQELRSARLDGDVVEVGDAYIPADAIETPLLRAASLRPRVPASMVVVRESAAWVHGSLAALPQSIQLKRLSATHDSTRLRMGGVWVTDPETTLIDLARARCAGHDVEASIDSLLRGRPTLLSVTLTRLTRSPPSHNGRAISAYLRGREGYDDVTR